MRRRKSVQQQQRRPLAADAGENAARGGVDPFGRIAGKQIGKIGHIAHPSSSANADDPVNTNAAVDNSRRGVLDTPHTRGMTASASNFVCRCRWRVLGLCHRSSPGSKNQQRKCHVDRFRNPVRGQGDPRKGAQMGARGMHPRGKGIGLKAARRGARQAPGEGARARAVVPVRAEGIWRHGARPARQRAGADGAWRKHAGRAVDEHARPRRRLDDDHSRARHAVPEGEIPKAAAQRRKAHLLLDDGEGGGSGRHRHADLGGEGRQRELHPERREVVLVFRQRRRHGAGDGQDRSERAAPQAVFDLHRRTAEPRLPHQAQHQEHGDRGPALRSAFRRPFRDRDQGSQSAGRQPARRRRQRLQHGPAPARLWPAAPRHAQHRQGPARARHGGRRMSPSVRPSACCSPTARRCSSCSPNAPASSISAA